jgi:hypothetical protein
MLQTIVGNGVWMDDFTLLVSMFADPTVYPLAAVFFFWYGIAFLILYKVRPFGRDVTGIVNIIVSILASLLVSLYTPLGSVLVSMIGANLTEVGMFRLAAGMTILAAAGSVVLIERR